MAISEEELKEMLKPSSADIEKITTLSDDGKNLLTRVPKEICLFLNMKKGNKLKWLVKADSKEMRLEVYDGKKDTD